MVLGVGVFNKRVIWVVFNKRKRGMVFVFIFPFHSFFWFRDGVRRSSGHSTFPSDFFLSIEEGER